jgi:hypothetical protein
MRLEDAAAALLAGIERACPAREAARLRKAGGPRPDVASDWTQLRPSRLTPATPGAFDAAVGAFARETRAAVAAAAARAVARAAEAGAAESPEDEPFSYGDDADAVPFEDDDAGGWEADADGGEEEAFGAAQTPRATPASGAKAPPVPASSPPRKRSPAGGSAFARRRRVRLTLGLTPATAAPALRRKRIFSDATPAERDAEDDDDDKVRPPCSCAALIKPARSHTLSRCASSGVRHAARQARTPRRCVAAAGCAGCRGRQRRRGR